jgi:glucose/arabinose dehydrogenase/PKD repeat protein
LAAALAIAIAVSAAVVPARGAGSVPLGFTDQLLFSFEQPTALAFTPDGRMLVASRPGRLYVAVNGALVKPASLDLRSKICSNSERGLVGVAVDPQFTTNHFIYLFYTYKKFSGCPVQDATEPVNRVSRFVLQDTNVIAPTSETVLIDNVPSVTGIHNAGDLNFGSDGRLYVSLGDAGCGVGSGYGCKKPRSRNTLLGKILRITRDGAAPADNPFQGSGTLPCALTGSTASGNTCREIYAMGLRNPFRFAMDPNTPGKFHINDVGHSDWEEIDLGQAGADYGWELREGHCARGSTTDCGPPPSGVTNPLFDYHHNTGCKSITGGAFVPNDSGWPASYLGKYLFGDFICGSMFRLDDNGSGFQATPFVTGHPIGSIVHMEFGPHEPKRALYYATFEDGGQVRKIAFTSDGRPIAEMTASPITGPTPLTVHFDGSASADPEGQSLLYHWDFGDGASDTTSSPLTSHTYTTAGDRTASLVVEDTDGFTSAPFTLRVVPGNFAPVPVIDSPVEGAKFRVGQTLTLTGTASDVEDGTYPASALTWNVWLFHRDHRHPYFGPATGNNLTFTGPAPEDLTAATNSYLVVELTVTDSRGISITASRDVMPLTVPLTFKTKPTGLKVRVKDQPFVCPVTLTSWAGWMLTIKAPNQGSYRFLTWSDNGAQEHTITTPNAATTYTANYVKLGG